MPGQSTLKIRPVKSIEIPLLKDFAPREWNTNIAQRFALSFGIPYFYPIVAEFAGEIVGCANGLLNETTGWLGNILVLPEFRGHGIGSSLTSHLVEYFRQHGCKSQLLVATKLGEPVYAKFGFTVSSTDTFLRSDKAIPARPTSRVRRAEPGDFEAMIELDQEITGEKRAAFLERFLDKGWVFQAGVNEPVTGFFLPDLESGPILARDATAGLELLQYKLGLGCTFVVVPTSNQPALDLLLSAGFLVENTAARMTLGAELEWIPERVFSRGGGFCG